MRWEKEETDGRYPILSPVDVEYLKEYIKEQCINEDFIDVESTIEQAGKLRT